MSESKQDDKLVIKFKYEKSRMIDLQDGRQYPIPMTMKMDKNALGFTTLLPIFDLEKIHSVQLLEEIPQLPELEPGMSKRYHQELCDEAFRVARENRKQNDSIRNRISIFQKSGTIKVVYDPFARKTSPDIDQTTALKPSQQAEVLDSGERDESDEPSAPVRKKK